MFGPVWNGKELGDFGLILAGQQLVVLLRILTRAVSESRWTPLSWTAAPRLQAVIATAAMDEATRGAWCREQGLYPA